MRDWQQTALQIAFFKVSNQFENYQIVIVGSGISGLVLAERYASLGKKVLVIEKRDHIGGNCYDYLNEYGILVSKYGAHLFHTNHEEVWQYVQRFSSFTPYQHRVLASVQGKLVPVPVNIKTVNTLFDLKIKSQAEMQKWLSSVQVPSDKPKNSEEVGLSRVGKELYELLFKNYTLKQWNKEPKELDPLVLARIPVRDNFDDLYFSDKYQAQPSKGFTALFEKMINHRQIKVLVNTDFFKVKQQITGYEKLFYTGPVDSFFSESPVQKLEYRSLRFEFETHNKEYYQENSVINYPNENDFTRIVEYKRITGQVHPQTTISKEFPQSDGEPYYPVPTWENRQLYQQYFSQVKKLKNIYFIGRLAEYRYINMDEAFLNALRLFARLENQSVLKFD